MSGSIKLSVSIIFCLFFFRSLQSVNSYPQSVRSGTHFVNESKQDLSLEHKYFSSDADDDMITFKDEYGDVLNETEKNPDDKNYTFLIVGGYRPPKHTFAKYTVSIRYGEQRKFFGDNHICGGTIVSTTAIMTAAHCVTRYSKSILRKLSSSDLTVVAGIYLRLAKTSAAREHEVDSFLVHPNYNPENMRNDIAMLYLEEGIQEDGVNRQVIQLIDDSPLTGTKCTVVGWGRLFMDGPLANEILYVDLAVWAFSRCSRTYGIRRGMFCASDENDFEKDACTGDSGGPVFCNGHVAGIVSYGFGCATPGMPGVYTDVARYYDWIKSNLSKSVVAYRLSFMVLVLSLMFVMICC